MDTQENHAEDRRASDVSGPQDQRGSDLIIESAEGVTTFAGFSAESSLHKSLRERLAELAVASGYRAAP